MTAAILATIGLGCLVPGPLAALLGWLELRAIERGDAPSAGEGFARVAIWVGALEGAALPITAVLFAL